MSDNALGLLHVPWPVFVCSCLSAARTAESVLSSEEKAGTNGICCDAFTTATVSTLALAMHLVLTLIPKVRNLAAFFSRQ